MKIVNVLSKLFLLSVFLSFGACEPDPEPDPCLKTKWPQAKEYEIKLAVRISETNPLLPGGAIGSQKPEDFEKLTISGTIEKLECNKETSGAINLGNSYIIKGVDYPAPIEESRSYWFGHVVYVLEFDNDSDMVDLNLNVKITMQDGQSYVCNFTEEEFYQQVVLVPTEMYYYILLDVYSDLWIKV
jgi:hypothetical protein